MEFSLLGGLIAGFAGTAVMSTMMKGAGRIGLTDMPPMEMVTGSMMSGDPDRAKQVGTMLHWLMMGTLLFGLGYAAVLSSLASTTWVTGILVGAAHGLVVGLVFMPMMPAMHPRMKADVTFDGTLTTSGGTVQLAAPGVLGAKWGGMTPVGLVMGHAVYGLVFALVYGAFVS